MIPIRPRRSALYMPGSNARAIEKAKTLDADVVIFDLEDAVAPDLKAQAREQGVNLHIGNVPLDVTDRALTSEQFDGFVKVLADHDGRLLGASSRKVVI